MGVKRVKKRNYKKLSDELWSKIIRSKGVCEFADRGNCAGILNAAHIIRRGNNALRHNIFNGLCLCVGHHFWFDKGDRFETTNYFNQKFPGRYELLHSENRVVHLKNHDWQEIYERLKSDYPDVR